MSSNDTKTEGPRIIILGALSAIAEAAARQWAENGATLLLAGRNPKKLETVSNDLTTRGAKVETFAIDLANADINQVFSEMVDRLGEVDVVLLAYGALGEQVVAEKDMEAAQNLISTNFGSAALWCLSAANTLEAQNHGSLIVIGSVAGDRGRMSNYIYGAAKGGLGLLVQGIAHRLASTGARAVLVKLGFVDTPMTASFKKGALWTKPDKVANYIVNIAERKSVVPVYYRPWFWWPIMMIIRNLPSTIMHRTKL